MTVRAILLAGCVAAPAWAADPGPESNRIAEHYFTEAQALLQRARAGALFAVWDGDSLAIIIVGAWPEAP